MVKITDVTMTVMMDGADGDDVVFQAQIEDGHGMAEHVSRSVRRLDAIQMRVQRALALVEDVINLRGCAEVGRREGRRRGGGAVFVCLIPEALAGEGNVKRGSHFKTSWVENHSVNVR